jgi:SAM-dependent methyltransferase
MEQGHEVAAVSRRPVDAAESARAQRQWWDRSADDYQGEHGAFLRGGFVWGPEGLREDQAGLLGPTRADMRALEVGCGAADCSRWLRAQAGLRRVVGVDISAQQLAHARAGEAQTMVPVVQADAVHLPFHDAVFDVVFSAFGAFPFVPDAAAAVAESARVLRPGGRLVFSVSHPVRWCFPDDPGERGLAVTQSYFDRRPYVEEDTAGRAVYVEHHHTLGDWVSAIAGAGLRLVDLVEPEWPQDNEQVWGGWSPQRGRLLPGTAIFAADKETATR